MTGASPATDPPPDCALCPRLAGFLDKNRALFPDFHNKPVPSFGTVMARILIVGLAPGLKGANRTGRPFTGDYAGDLLYKTLIGYGFARGRFEARVDDGLELVDCRITNAVRCVPPDNKPLPAEIMTCRRFLEATIVEMPNLRAIVALGRVAHDTVLRVFGQPLSSHPFAHGACHGLGTATLYDSYHCSRYNTNTGVLTEAMFMAVFETLRADLG